MRSWTVPLDRVQMPCVLRAPARHDRRGAVTAPIPPDRPGPRQRAKRLRPVSHEICWSPSLQKGGVDRRRAVRYMGRLQVRLSLPDSLQARHGVELGGLAVGEGGCCRTSCLVLATAVSPSCVRPYQESRWRCSVLRTLEVLAMMEVANAWLDVGDANARSTAGVCLPGRV